MLSISGPTLSPGQGHLQFRKRAVKLQVTVGQGANRWACGQEPELPHQAVC